MSSAVVLAAVLLAPEAAPPAEPSEAAATPASATEDEVEAEPVAVDPDPGEASAQNEEQAAEPEFPTADTRPLPPAPPATDPSQLPKEAWRGVGFFQIHLGATIPAGGSRPAAGTVVSAGGGIQAGWRPSKFFAVGVGVTTFVHDAGREEAVDSSGERVEVTDLGRMTVFDAAFVRAYIPMMRRVEPRFDVGALVGTYRGPFTTRARVVSGVRAGAGVDLWVGPAFSIDVSVDPRLLVVGDAVGFTVQAGLGATVHW